MPTVMVVDETETARAALTRLLHREGYETVCASNGPEVLDSLERSAGRAGSGPDLILMDTHASELDGLELLDSLQRDDRWRSLPVVLFSGGSDYYCIRRAEQLGAKHLLVKATFSVCEMLEHVRRYTDHAHH